MTTTDLKLSKLHQVALSVTDLARSVAFYRDEVGLDFMMQFDPPGLAFFDIGGTRLMLDAIAEAAGHASPLYFWVDDMDSAVATMKSRGLIFEGDPHVINTEADGTEEWMAFFKDPDENILALATKKPPAA
jgi:catechol 2,3-dioxygenase-like lactoylglutathione lyase family enzyme